ncbi:intradiol ring-cleavage dioxygenase [Pseudorhodoferax sp. Leaf274]|uniref:dioxygenase family protein n=1 Tax=Pseudorhodoferax sp. Leaf274 TaxID=1736318 RepID=UPI000702F3AD|nr:intradiol ring-cleavage dioxygenase [Pseudorhodoferax sp. Leaf274]KQP44659.1 intradiol ring-cleavage dioxygenase [Pseudorhodoferax sp. Leaf274]
MPTTDLRPAPPRAFSRRHTLETLGAFGALGSLGLLGCGGGEDATTATGTTTTTTTTGGSTSTGTTTETSASCAVVPEETAGPYPADGSTASSRNYNVLGLAGIVRSDIRTSIGSTARALGVPLTVEITLTSTTRNCAALEGYAIYLWHCTADGNYSVYTTQSVDDNQLRGVQATDANGTVRFTTIVPGCYAGRVPHMHLEVYRSLATATAAANKLRTTQLAFPSATMGTIYNSSSLYSASIRNFNSISLATDNIFSDGYDLEMTTMTGNTTDGYTAAITISIAS